MEAGDKVFNSADNGQVNVISSTLSTLRFLLFLLCLLFLKPSRTVEEVKFSEAYLLTVVGPT